MITDKSNSRLIIPIGTIQKLDFSRILYLFTTFYDWNKTQDIVVKNF